MIPNTDERIPRRAFQPHVPRIRTRCTTISPIRACMRLCACTQGGKDGRGRPEGLSEVRTVHYPRSRTPLRLFDSFPFAHPCVHRLPPPTLERVGLPRSSPSVYHYIHASRAATRQHTDLFPLSGTQPRRVTSLRWMPAERRNTGRKSASGGEGGGGGGKVTARRLQRERCCATLEGGRFNGL